MQKSFLLAVLLFMTFILPVQAQADPDFYHWNILSLRGEICPGSSWQLLLHHKYDPAQDYHVQWMSIKANRQISPVLNVGLIYNHFIKRSGSFDWRLERRPVVEVNLKKDFGNLGFRDRNWFEFKFPEASETGYGYRQRLGLEYKMPNSKLGLTPLVYQEFFFDSGNWFQLTRSWAQTGVKAQFSSLQVMLRLIYESVDVNAQWQSNWILHTAFVYTL